MRKNVVNSKISNKQKASSTVWYTNNDETNAVGTTDKTPATQDSNNKISQLPHAATAFTALDHLDKEHTATSSHHPYQYFTGKTRWFLGLQTEPSTNKTIFGDLEEQKIIQWMEAYRRKIKKTSDLLENEQKSLQEKTNEFLIIVKEADSNQASRIKSVYDKKTKKITNNIRTLQRKIITYQTKFEQLKRMEEENKFRMLDRCGSVDNLNSKTETPVGQTVKKVCLTLPRSSKYRSAEFLPSKKHPKISPQNAQNANKTVKKFSLGVSDEDDDDDDGVDDDVMELELTGSEVEALFRELDQAMHSHKELESVVQELQNQVKQTHEEWRLLLAETRYHSDHLEEQINDMMELHQQEVLNMKQELSSLEDKLEYQLDERMRDLQDLVEACQTKMSKMEVQQQQLVPIEALEQFSMKSFATKMANFFLSLLAIVFIFLSMNINFFKSLVTNRRRFGITCLLIFISLMSWRCMHCCKDAISSSLSTVSMT